MSFNKVILMGRTTEQPELKQTQTGTSVSSFNIAVNRRFKGEDGQQNVDFISIVAWRNQAEFVCKYFKKGQAILICGQLQTRTWTDSQGNKRYATEVVADEVGFVGNKESNTEPKNTPSANAPSADVPYMPTGYSTESSLNFEEIDSDEPLPL